MLFREVSCYMGHIWDATCQTDRIKASILTFLALIENLQWKWFKDLKLTPWYVLRKACIEEESQEMKAKDKDKETN